MESCMHTDLEVIDGRNAVKLTVIQESQDCCGHQTMIRLGKHLQRDKHNKQHNSYKEQYLDTKMRYKQKFHSCVPSLIPVKVKAPKGKRKPVKNTDVSAKKPAQQSEVQENMSAVDSEGEDCDISLSTFDDGFRSIDGRQHVEADSAGVKESYRHSVKSHVSCSAL